METQESYNEKQIKRHGLTTFWLYYTLLNGLMMIVLFTFFQAEVEKILDSTFTPLYINLMITIGLLNGFSSALLLKWKKIGFHIFIIANIIKLYANMDLNADVMASMLGLLDVLIMYMILKLKKDGVSTWERLDREFEKTERSL